MRILLVHNFYGSTAPSGENKVFEAEKAMLEKHGEIVETYTRHSDEIRVVNRNEELGIRGKIRKLYGMVKGAMCTIGNPFAALQLKKKIEAFKPDVVHFHNTFPLISPLAILAAHRTGAKVVLTLHNYRCFCAAGAPTRNGKVCTICIERRSAWSGVLNRCYRESLFATVPLTINIALYRRFLDKWVDRFIVMSEFQKRMMIKAGLDDGKIMVKAHSVDIPLAVGEEEMTRKNAALYAGRLSDEKGVGVLIEAWNRLGKEAPQLYVAGGGDSRDRYVAMCKNDKVIFLGPQPHVEVLKLLKQVRAIVVPSVCYETFGLSIVESAKMGVPAIVSDLGSLPSLIVEGVTGLTFNHGDAGDLANKVKELFNPGIAEQMGDAAFKASKKHYTEEENYKRLMEIYLNTQSMS